MNLDFCLNVLGIQQANLLSQMAPFLSSFIKENLRSGVQLWRDPGRSFHMMEDLLSKNGSAVASLDMVPLIHHLRVIKSRSEQELMRRTCSIIADAAIETMKVRRNIVGIKFD